MDKLVRERKSLEPRLKRISDTVDKIVPEAVEEIDIQIELDALSEVWAAFCAVHKKILDVSEDEKAYEDAVQRQGKFEACYIALKNSLLKTLKVVKDRDSAATQQISPNDVIRQLADQQAEFLRMMSTNMAATSSSSAIVQNNAAASDLKLPRMNMPVFSGNYLEWQSFYDLFDSLVHQNPMLKDSQKLYFLKTNLAGEAASLISHLKIGDANYRSALEKLKSRYDKPREIANEHIKRFLAQPTLTSSSSHGLRSLHDVSDEVIRALKAMNREDRDTWLLFIISEKVDPDTKQLWCQKIAEMDEANITLECFLKFIESRSFALQSAQPTKPKASVPFKQPPKTQPQPRGATAFVATNPPFCNVCNKQSHHLYQCGKFIHMNHDERLALVNRMKLCNNCLRVHPGESCKSGTCRKCDLPHHTLLHPASSSANAQPTTSSSVMAQANPGSSAQSLISALDSPTCLDASSVLLATVAINVLDSHGRPHACRAVLDCASQVSFVSENFCRQLGLNTVAANMDLEGISSTPAHADKCAEIIISSRCTDYRTSVSCLVLEKIAKMLPCKPANIDDWPIPGSIHLADPLFHRPGKVEVLLGIELFFQLLEPGKIALSPDNSLPTLQNTKLGWVVAGRYHESNTSVGSHVSTCLLTSTDDDLSQQLRKFWELEEYATASNHLTEEEQRCEQHFSEHTVRDESGKFVVRLPFLLDPHQLGESRQIAEKRLHHIERKMDRNPQLKSEYHAFIREYIDLGHMSLVEDTTIANKSVYLPHHCVVKTTSSTTKCRVVFDASAKTTSGLSLNDVLMCGPVVQDSLVNILIRFRFPPIVLVGDAKQMYRMVWLNELDRDFLKILWRWAKDEDIREYRLNTVTFGTKSASYLATKCVQQLLESYRHQYPVAVEKAEKGIYVDDVLTGASSEEEAKVLREQLTEMFAAGGFHLRKWASNSAAVLEGVPDADLEVKIPIEENGSSTIKALGMQWQPCSDEFHFSYQPTEILQPTKRIILSQIASLFDPLGLLAPIIVKAKLVMQRMWELKVAWDATPPGELTNDWLVLVQKFSLLNSFQIPRQVIDMRNWSRLYLHGYCDASDVAMGACIYIRAVSDDGNTSFHLLCAKSKLAPIGNGRTTTPRLELCAAVILARLIFNVRAALSTTTFYEVQAFSDSKVVLAWLAGGAARWKTFVANRVAEISNHLPSINWHHVGTLDNPADLVSRGSFPDQLQANSLWWHGPAWDSSEKDSESSPNGDLDTNEQRQIDREQRTTAVVCFTVYENRFLDDMMARYYPSLQVLLRITARMLRFGHPEFRCSSRLSPDEIDFALGKYLQHTQQQHFPRELSRLQKGLSVERSSPLHQLNPFLDENGVVRVGGRLRQSDLSYDNKHPILLPRHSILTSLILHHEHQEHLHCGPQSLLAATRTRFWILRGSSAARKVCRDCVKCNRAQPARITQQMGQLPADRVKPLPPFAITGVDYAGPVNIVGRRTRGAVPSKGYIALFVCLGTRAVHLEAVSDLSAASFLAAFTPKTKSAIYYEQGEYELTLANIALAKSHNYPERLMPKLMARESNCHEKLGSVTGKAKQFPILTLTSEANPRIPFLSKGISARQLPIFGNCLVAEQDFKAGDVILHEKPMKTCLCLERKFTHCNRCLSGNLLHLIPCPNCTSAMFCNKECLQEGLKMHRFECGATAKLLRRNDLLLGPRMFFQGLTLFNDDVDKLMAFCQANKETDKSFFDLDYSNYDPLEEFKTFIGTRIRYDLGYIALLQMTAAMYCHMFMEIPLVRSLFTTETQKNFMAQCFFDNIYLTMAMGIYRHPIDNNIGQLYPVASICNHSCDPNTLALHYGGQMTFVVLRPIRRGEQIFISYGAQYNQPCTLRSNWLRALGFICTCDVCDKDKGWLAKYKQKISIPPEHWLTVHRVAFEANVTNVDRMNALQQFVQRYAANHPQENFSTMLLEYSAALTACHKLGMEAEMRKKIAG